MKKLLRGCACWLIAIQGLAAAAAGGERSHPLSRVFTISPRRLADTRTRIQGNDTSLKPAVDKLRREANKALKAGPFSVMDKSLTPPSGDKHDYLSLAPYEDARYKQLLGLLPADEVAASRARLLHP